MKTGLEMPRAICRLASLLSGGAIQLAHQLTDAVGALVGLGVASACHGARSVARDLFEVVGLDDVALLEVLEVRQAYAALEAGGDLSNVVLEPAQ